MAETVEMAKYLLMLVLLMAVAWADESSPAVVKKPVKAVPVAEPTEVKVEAEEPEVQPEEVKSDKPAEPEEVEDKVEPTETEVEEYSERFLTFTTSTFTKFLTTSPVCTFSTSCATFAADVTACRRRRGIDEEAQQVADDAVKIEASQPIE
jgi:outer membrane biosynthesis protein TonB